MHCTLVCIIHGYTYKKLQSSLRLFFIAKWMKNRSFTWNLLLRAFIRSYDDTIVVKQFRQYGIHCFGFQFRNVSYPQVFKNICNRAFQSELSILFSFCFSCVEKIILPLNSEEVIFDLAYFVRWWKSFDKNIGVTPGKLEEIVFQSISPENSCWFSNILKIATYIVILLTAHYHLASSFFWYLLFNKFYFEIIQIEWTWTE